MKLNNYLFRHLTSPIAVIIFILSLILVFFRMKSIDQDLKLNALNEEVGRATNINKDLKVKKANLLNTTNLNSYANKFKMSSPKPSQIIVINND
jgi:cell division protein FtsL